MSIAKYSVKEQPAEQPKAVKEETNRILASTPPEVDRALYEMLEVYGRETSDPDTQEKVKFISDALGENPKDSLMRILGELGTTPQGENKLRRVYRYLKLQQQAEKILKHYEMVKQDMNFMREHRWE